MNYISIKEIMNDITNNPLLSDISLETVVSKTEEFIRIIGSPELLECKVADITISNYRGELPCDIYKINQVRLIYNNEPVKTIRKSTDLFTNSSHTTNYDLTYKTTSKYILTSISKGTIEISYDAITADDDGYPMIPDDASYKRALELYIKLYWYTILFDMGSISGAILQNTQSEYAFAVAQCQTSIIMPDIDDMENISNMWNKVIPDADKNYDTNFSRLGSNQHIKIH